MIHEFGAGEFADQYQKERIRLGRNPDKGEKNGLDSAA